jgi:hypothetical protein
LEAFRVSDIASIKIKINSKREEVKRVEMNLIVKEKHQFEATAFLAENFLLPTSHFQLLPLQTI